MGEIREEGCGEIFTYNCLSESHSLVPGVTIKKVLTGSYEKCWCPGKQGAHKTKCVEVVEKYKHN